MNVVISLVGRLLSAVAFLAFHLFAALFVLFYVVAAGTVGAVRWFGRGFRGRNGRQHPRVAAARAS